MDHVSMRDVKVKLERIDSVVPFAASTMESVKDVPHGPPSEPRGRKPKRLPLPSVIGHIEPWERVEEELPNKQKKRVLKDASKHIEDFIIWRPGLAFEPIAGHIYICRGKVQDRFSIAESDSLRWHCIGRNTSKTAQKWRTFYYVASMKKYFHKRKPQTSEVNLRKKIIFDPVGFFFLEYSENAKLPPTTKPANKNKNIHPKEESELDDDPFADFYCSDMDDLSIENPDDLRCNTPSPVMRTFPVEESGISYSIQVIDELPEPTVQRATTFRTSKELSNLHDIHSVLSLQFQDWKLQANDVHLKQIVDPQGGDDFLMDVSNLESFEDIFHCDKFSWKRKSSKYWSHLSFITHKYVLVKDSKILPEFKRIIHYMPSTKLMLVRYSGGSSDLIEMSQKTRTGDQKYSATLEDMIKTARWLPTNAKITKLQPDLYAVDYLNKPLPIVCRLFWKGAKHHCSCQQTFRPCPHLIACLFMNKSIKSHEEALFLPREQFISESEHFEDA